MTDNAEFDRDPATTVWDNYFASQQDPFNNGTPTLGEPFTWTTPFTEPPANWTPLDASPRMSDADVDEYFRDLDERRRGRIVSIRAIGGNSLGDYIVGDAADTSYNTSIRTTSALEAFATRLDSYGATATKSVLDSIGPAGEPSYEVTYEDGSRYIQLASELSTGAYAVQAMWVSPILFSRFVVRPGAGAAAPKVEPVAPRVGEPAAPEVAPGQSSYLPGRYAHSASDANAYWNSGRRVFPTLKNSRLKGPALRAEQKGFFKHGLLDGKSAAELRGQARQAGYRRYGGINSSGGPDRLADIGAEKMLLEAMKELGL